MFAGLPDRSRQPSKATLVISLALHFFALLLVIQIVPEFMLTQPSVLRSTSNGVIAVPVPFRIPTRSFTVPVKAPHKKDHPRRQQMAVASPLPLPLPEKEGLGPVLKTSALWHIGGFHEIKIALPQVTPPPEISRAELPLDFQGDIVVEVVIDKQGSVARTRVLQTFGSGLESRVVAALKDWKFKPAMYDGVPVASLQDIYFHFPDSAHP